MQKVSIFEAKTHLSSLISSVERSGERVIICRHGVAVAELSPIPHGSRTTLDPLLRKILIKGDPTAPTIDEWEDA